jgi:hypothetical protein
MWDVRPVSNRHIGSEFIGPLYLHGPSTAAINLVLGLHFVRMDPSPFNSAWAERSLLCVSFDIDEMDPASIIINGGSERTRLLAHVKSIKLMPGCIPNVRITLVVSQFSPNCLRLKNLKIVPFFVIHLPNPTEKDTFLYFGEFFYHSFRANQ